MFIPGFSLDSYFDLSVTYEEWVECVSCAKWRIVPRGSYNSERRLEMQ